MSSLPCLPLPLTPCYSEDAREVEYQRALVAEAAMRAGPAITKQDVLYEDEWLLVVNKPGGLYTGHVFASAPSVMQSADAACLHLANRLDRDTSGVLVISKSREASGKLGQLFARKKVAKSYVGLCIGAEPPWRAVTVTSGHGRPRFGSYHVYSADDIGKRLPGPGGSVVKEMRTRFLFSSVSEKFQRSVVSGALGCDSDSDRDSGNSDWKDETDHHELRVAGRDCAVSQQDLKRAHTSEHFSASRLPDFSASQNVQKFLVRAFPSTGRTHQIRLHCLYLGLPLVGDVKYGAPQLFDGIKFDAHCLHAGSLSFKHPITSGDVLVVAPLPSWATEVCAV